MIPFSVNNIEYGFNYNIKNLITINLKCSFHGSKIHEITISLMQSISVPNLEASFPFRTNFNTSEFH